MNAVTLSTIEAGKLTAQQYIYALLLASGMTAKGLVNVTHYDRCTVYRTLSRLRALGLISTRKMDARSRIYLAMASAQPSEKPLTQAMLTLEEQPTP